MICENIKLGGYLVKWALKKKDGRYYERDCKKHNTITKSCLNNLFEFNGPSSVVSNNYNDYTAFNWLWNNGISGTNTRYGVFNFCALGNGTGETSLDDTELKNKVGDYTSTKWAGQYYSSRNTTNNTFSHRMAHAHTITDTFTIKEIGWFNRIYPDGVYSLSARVQLDEFVDVEQGDTFYTVYELVLHFPTSHAVDIPILGKAISLQKNAENTAISDKPYCFVQIGSSSIQIIGPSGGANCPKIYPAYCFGVTSLYNIDQYLFNYMTTDNANVEVIGQLPYWASGGQRPFAVNLHAYTQDSFYRDIELSFVAVNANVYSFVINGCILRLGEYDENNTFVPNPYYMDKALKFTIRQRISTDLLTPTA